MHKLSAGISALCVLLAPGWARAAAPEDVASAFNASLAAARAKDGNTLVNGTFNMLVEPGRTVQAGSAGLAGPSAAPVVFVDPSDHIRQVNLVVRSPSRTIIQTSPDTREVALAPVMTQSQFRTSRAALPMGAIVLPDRSVRPVEVARTTMLTGVVMRRK